MIFLRPWFLLLLCVPFLFWVNAKIYAKGGAWAAVCDAHLLPYLTIDVEGQQNKFYHILMFVIWCIACIALSGPAVLKKDVQAGTMQSGLMVVVDMSPVMDKKSIEQAMHKLYDITEYEKDLTIGLILTDKKAYVALPLTQDKSILKSIIPSLKENIMPARGENVAEGIKLAGQSLLQSGFKKGQILLLTAGVSDANELIGAIQKSSYPVSVIGVGERKENAPVFLSDGSFWNNGKMAGLSDIKKQLGSNFSFATIDETDLKSLLSNRHFEQTKKVDMLTTEYQDLGVWLLVLLLPFIALLFRRGVLYCVAFMLISMPVNAGVWWRSEQEFYQKQMQAIADFNIGHYDEALKEFQSIYKNDSDVLYNMGNTLAYMGKINEAIKAYEDVLKQNPNHADAAFNLDYLKRHQPPEASQNSSGGASEDKKEQQNSDQSQGKSSDEKQQQKKEQQSGPSQESDKEQQENDQPEQEKNAENTQPQNVNQQEDKTENSKEAQSEKQKENEGEKKNEGVLSQSENKQQEENKTQSVMASEQKQKEWLDRINSDAGRVLRYRLIRQYEAQK